MSNRLYETPEDFIAMLKSRPDHMVVTHKFIAVWHTGLASAILIPGRFDHISNEAAQEILNENLKALRAQIIS